MRRILKSVNTGAGDDLLKFYIPVFLIERVMLAGHDEQRDAQLGELFDECIGGRARLVRGASEPRGR